jgi:diacylglycerol kinase
MRKHVHRFAVLMTLVSVLSPEAKAYSDPGSGALLWQMLVASLVGLLFYARKALNWFGKKRR